MGLEQAVRRRVFGAVSLGMALLMLILGQTVLQHELSGWPFLMYWLVCLVFTSVSIGVALVDARATRLQVKRERRELLEETLKEIKEEAARKRLKKRR